VWRLPSPEADSEQARIAGHPSVRRRSILEANTSTASNETRWGNGSLVDTAELPGGGRLHLLRRGQDFEILFGEEQLMGSWDSESEEALATIVCERLGPEARRLLIGGLGMGFTLAAALKAAPADASIVVAELVPKVVAWAKGPLAHLFGDSLSDPRVTLEIRDVSDVIEDQSESLDAILLDVDNGPDGLIHLANERLYCNWGLRTARAALRPGGILAVWSAYPDRVFHDRLKNAGFAVEEIRMVADDDDDHHFIWLATKPL
jgi:spermidine synthase